MDECQKWHHDRFSRTNIAYPYDDDNKHHANKNYDGPLEPLFTALRAESYFGQITHEVAVS